MVAAEVKAIAHQPRWRRQAEIGGLGGGMESQPLGMPAGNSLDRLIHHLGHRSHAHQMAQGRGQKRGKPEGQPVVGEVEDPVERPLLLEGPAPEAGQQGTGRDRHGGVAGAVLPAGLVNPWLLPQAGGSASGGQHRSLRRQHGHRVAAAQQAGHDHPGGVLHSAAPATAEVTHRRAHHQHPHPVPPRRAPAWQPRSVPPPVPIPL